MTEVYIMIKWHYISTSRWTIAIQTRGGIVTKTPPIARWMLGKRYPDVVFDIRVGSVRWHDLNEEVLNRIRG